MLFAKIPVIEDSSDITSSKLEKSVFNLLTEVSKVSHLPFNSLIEPIIFLAVVKSEENEIFSNMFLNDISLVFWLIEDTTWSDSVASSS